MYSEYDQFRDYLYKAYSLIPQMTVSEYQNYIIHLFRFQYKYNITYQQYCRNLGFLNINEVSLDKIPFLPISAFKHHEVKTGSFASEMIFTSSGTTSQLHSHHHIKNLTHYLSNTEKIWNLHFKPLDHYCFLALLPGYMQRAGSSLISMCDFFISKSKYKESGFYLNDLEKLYATLNHNNQANIPTVLIGVSYALIDFADRFPMKFENLTMIETGGMKGTRKEISKSALHAHLSEKLKTKHIFSEYGMTELLSQTYTRGDTRFRSNLYMKVTTKQLNDPLSNEKLLKPGIICIQDTANIDSCAFLQTEDMGIIYADDTFEITGRMNAAEWRGCNLLLQELEIS